MDRGIIMSRPNVLALLAKRKFRTMRPMKPQPPEDALIVKYHDENYLVEELRGKVSWFVPCDEARDYYPCNREDAIKPRYAVGDRLYVRETFLPDPPINGKWDNYLFDDGSGQFNYRWLPEKYKCPKHCIYKADWRGDDLRWKPSIFMTKWAARIWMTCTKVTVQRPQELSVQDIIAEGISPKNCTDATIKIKWYKLYESVYGIDKWNQNLWHFVYWWDEIEIKGES